MAVAFNAGNLGAVAKTMRERFPTLPLIVCADDDSTTAGTAGRADPAMAAVEKSTGPRTKPGKAKASQNAYQGG